jgi:energy-coupling factor transporter ATP-binding protein EcfA2
METVLSVWLEVQNKWCELEEMFSTSEVLLNLPHDAYRFVTVGKEFSELLKKTSKNPNILQCCCKDGMLPKLEKMNENLRLCHQSLLKLLQKRRHHFPRFYFLALEDVLHVVCCGSNPNKINKYISKLFPNVLCLKINEIDRETGTCCHVTAVHSFGGWLNLNQQVSCFGPVEHWLNSFHDVLRSTLKEQLLSIVQWTTSCFSDTQTTDEGDAKSQFASYFKQLCLRENTVNNQLLLLAAEIELASQFRSSINDYKQNGHKALLERFLQCICTGLQHCIGVLKECHNLPTVTVSQVQSMRESIAASRLTNVNNAEEMDPDFTGLISRVQSLILVLNQYQQMTINLVEADTSSPVNGQHIEYILTSNGSGLHLHLGDYKLEYGFEMQSATKRLIMTPNAERYFVHLAAAVSNKIFSLCLGEEGSGKSESILELAQLCGRALFVVHCVKATGHACVKDVLQGMASTGVWLCFTAIDKLESSVLSLTCRLLQTISSALHSGKSSVTIQERDTALVPGGICFSTSTSSTPIQVARNTGVDFRTIDFQAPQLKPIAEALLMREGFTYWSLLANKLTSLYCVCRNILIEDSITGYDSLSCGLHGIGIATVRYVVSLASSIMRNLLTMKRVELAGTVLQDFDTAVVGDCSSHLLHTKSPKTGTDLGVDEVAANGMNTIGDEADVECRIEEQAVIFALKDLFLPRLSGDDRKLFMTVLSEIFSLVDNMGVPKANWQNQLKLARQTTMLKMSTGRSTPATTFQEVRLTSRSRIEEAIPAAVKKLKIQSSPSFCVKIVQLSQLLNICNTVAVVGSAGCGKTTTIQVLGAAIQQTGYNVQNEFINIRAIQSDFLFGYWDTVDSEWKDGILLCVLRKISSANLLGSKRELGTQAKSVMKWVTLDGQLDSHQMEIFLSLFGNTRKLSVLSNETIHLPDTVKILWEVDSLANISPSVACRIGVLSFSQDIPIWTLYLKQWLGSLPEHQQCPIRELVDLHVDAVVKHLCTTTGSVLPVSELNAVSTLCCLLEALLDGCVLNETDYRQLFSYAVVWAFGGHLNEQSRVHFSDWWKDRISSTVAYPCEGTVFDYYVKPGENSGFVLCNKDASLPLAKPVPTGIRELYIHTWEAECLGHIVNLLLEASCPVLIVGRTGCGKTSFISDHCQAICSGDAAAIQFLAVHVNISTSGDELWDQISQYLEWNSGRKYVPKRSKKLLCLIDDLHMGKVCTRCLF